MTIQEVLAQWNKIPLAHPILTDQDYQAITELCNQLSDDLATQEDPVKRRLFRMGCRLMIEYENQNPDTWKSPEEVA